MIFDVPILFNERTMRFRNLEIALSACLLMTGIGCLDDTGFAKTQDETGQVEQGLELRGNKADRVNQLVVQASRDFSSGDYRNALEKSTEICKLEPDNITYQVFRGEVGFAAGRIDQCLAAYDEVIRLRPSLEPQLWQRGLALYYAHRFEDGVKQFETHQTVNSQDVENAVWHLLCASQISDIDQARKKLIPINGDKRVPMSQIYEMFAGRMTPEEVLETARKTTSTIKPGSEQLKLQLYYAYLYTGLYHEMLDDPVAATASLKKAVDVSPLGKTNFMGQVARVHLLLRGAVTAEEH